ncbi:MAG: DUF5667 domain-containing protein [bacterium]|nr:DUF5667 domain-containing protein [bacterium]
MKKTFISSTVVVVALFMFASGITLAHAQDRQIVLPSAGLTPENPLYFFDRLGETLQEFFTFNPEGKARLQITFAAERIAEIKIILETKGVEAKGLDVAQSRLRANIAKAAGIVEGEKSKGKDVSKLAKELDDEFEDPKTALEQAFKAEKRVLEAKEDELKAKIRIARQAGDTAQVEALVGELGAIKAQKELLDLKEDEQAEELEQEEEKIEREIEARAEAEKAIRKAEEEKQEVLSEAGEKGVSVPAAAFEKFDKLLLQAKELFAKENYVGARQLAKQAKKSLDAVEEGIEDLDEANEKEEELKEEQDEKERELMKEEAEDAREEAKQEIERLEKERERATEDTRKAEESLREAGDESD